MPPLMYETHMHTPLCKHAEGEPEEYAAVAERRGLRGIIVTCHNAMPNNFGASVRMMHEQFEDYCCLVSRAEKAMKGRIEVHLGLECDYFPGYEKWLESQVVSAPFNYILGSVHPQQKEYKVAYWRNDPIAFFRQYFEHLAMAAETKLFDTISHPDLVKNIVPSKWNVELIIDDIRRALDRIAAAGCSMELNTSGLNKDLPEMNPGPVILREMRARGISVVIGADAHVPQRVGDKFPEALALLEEAGYQQVSYYLGRKRHDLLISEAKASLK